MYSSKTIQVYEYDTIKVDVDYGNGKEVVFNESHFTALSQYLTENSNCGYYELLNKRVRFKNYVGVIKVGDLTIEVLPKCDRYDSEQDKNTWQNVLIEMLAISMQVEAKTTTHADIHIRQHTVLETYLNIFLNETAALIHHGLVKKYRTDESNQNALKGKLQIHKHITTNIVHAERFYVSHQVYDRDNVYNSILCQTLQCIRNISASISLTKRCESLLLNFPECKSVVINEKLFERLGYDRKTERYKTAISLARIILMNYHPDIKGGRNNILAIMFDMNLLWENYVYYIIKRAIRKEETVYSIKAQRKKLFWKHEDSWNIRLKPDIVISDENTGKTFVLDTKWKYQSKISVEDVRQMFAYGKYFNSNQSYLVYPDKSDDIKSKVKKKKGYFYHTDIIEEKLNEENGCGLLFVDLLKSDNEKSVLNKEIGHDILNEIKS